MDYMTLKEGKRKMGRFVPTDKYYCTDGRIPGPGGLRLGCLGPIPKEAEKPKDQTKGGGGREKGKILVGGGKLTKPKQ